MQEKCTSPSLAAPSLCSKASKAPIDSLKKTDIQASTGYEYAEVCNGARITNAADYTTKKDILFALEYKDIISDGWRSGNLNGPQTVNTKPGSWISNVSVVMCANADEVDTHSPISCPFGESYAVTYRTAYYEAKTARKIADGGTVASHAPTCPTHLRPEQKVFYAEPDGTAWSRELSRFLAE